MAYDNCNNWEEQQEVMEKYKPHTKRYKRQIKLLKINIVISSSIKMEDKQHKAIVPIVNKDDDTQSAKKETVKQKTDKDEGNSKSSI